MGHYRERPGALQLVGGHPGRERLRHRAQCPGGDDLRAPASRWPAAWCGAAWRRTTPTMACRHEAARSPSACARAC